MLNDDKTELMLLIGTRQQLQKVNLNDITVGDKCRGKISCAKSWVVV